MVDIQNPSHFQQLLHRCLYSKTLYSIYFETPLVPKDKKKLGMLVYGLVARENTVLAEYTAASGNFPTVTRALLSKIPTTDGRMSYTYDQHVFHYIVDDGMTFLCMAEKDHKRRVAFLFLEDLKTRFRAMYGNRGANAIAFAMNEEFQHVIRRQMEYYNSNSEADSLTRAQQQLDEVKDIAVENIDKIWDRGKKLELLVDRTDKLNSSSVKFSRSGGQLRRTMWRRKMKLYLLLFFLAVFVLYLVISMACGFDMSGCRGQH